MSNMSAEEASIPFASDPAHQENSCRPEMRDFEEACASGDTETVTNIVNGNGIPYDLNSGLREALRTGKLDLARFLLDKGAQFYWAGKTEARTMANCKLTRPCLDLLAEHGFDINAPQRGVVHDPDSILHNINVMTNESHLKWLLENGADPNLYPSYFGSVLDMAAELGTVAVIDLLLKYGAKLENSFPLHVAAGTGPQDAARLSRVLPPEYHAVMGDRIPVMRRLLEVGVDVNGSVDKGTPHYRLSYPLHCAIMDGPLVNVRFLLENGADPNLKNSRGKTAFELADMAKGGMDELLREFSTPK